MCSANGVGLGHLQEEMSHILILLEGRQHGVINLLSYLFWVILFEIIGSDNGETSAYEPCGVPFMTASSVLCVLGKVAIQKEDLQKYHNRDTWFQLQHVDADSEVQVRPSVGPRGHRRSLGTGETLLVAKEIDTGIWS